MITFSLIQQPLTSFNALQYLTTYKQEEGTHKTKVSDEMIVNIIQPQLLLSLDIMSIKKIADKYETVKKEDLYLNLSLLNTSSSLITKVGEPTSLELRISAPDSCKPKQKKLNSGIRRAETDRLHVPESFKKNKSIYQPIDVNANKKARLSIIRTLSLCYVSQFKTISKKIPNINKLDTSGYPQTSKDIGLADYDIYQKFTKINMMAPNPNRLKELIKRNKNLITVNEALLKETQMLQQEIIGFDFQLSQKTEKLEQQETINQELMRQMEVVKKQKKEIQTKMVHLLKVNEQLLRDNNNIKEKVKTNMKDIRMIRVEMGIQQIMLRKNQSLSFEN